jgi:uncharacterized protein YceH (UPF0502 family)
MHPFADLQEVHATLERLIERELAVRLARRPGQKEERYEQLLGAEQEGEEGAAVAGVNGGPASQHHDAAPGTGGGSAFPRDEDSPSDGEPSTGTADLVARVEKLEREVAELRAAVAPTSASDPAPRETSGWAAQR